DALKVVQTVFEPPPEVRKDPATKTEEKVVVPAPDLEPKEHADLLLLKGMALSGLSRSDEAVSALEEALKLDPTLRPARRELGNLFFGQKKYAQALEAWRPELAEGYRGAELLFKVGQAHYALGREGHDAGEIEAARLSMQSVLLERPNSEVQRWLALLAYETG